MYDLLYITNLPAFYKINLLNRIAEKRKLLVIFIEPTNEQRNKDFTTGDRCFECITLQTKNKVYNLLKLITILSKHKFNKLIVGGWDYPEYWISILISKKKRNGVVVESSIHESQTNGLKGYIKRIFMKRISSAFVSGKSHEQLVKSLNFKGNIIKTRGVGIFNLVPQPVYQAKNEVTNFIYVGRLSEEKNLLFLINVFNRLPHLKLNIVGYGPQEKVLKSAANNNIVFHGAVANKDLTKFYQENDVFVLPSTSEPWGLVVEEALNNGLPVIVSNRVGCAEEIINETNGIVFNLSESNSLYNAIIEISHVKFYNNLRINICKLDFDKLAIEQIECYK